MAKEKDTRFIYPSLDAEVLPIEVTAGKIAKNLLLEASQPGITSEWRKENIRAAGRFLVTSHPSDKELQRSGDAGIFPYLNEFQRSQLTELYQAEQAAEMSSWEGARIWARSAAKSGAQLVTRAIQRVGVSEPTSKRMEPKLEKALLIGTSALAAGTLACALLGRGFLAPARTATPGGPTHGPDLGSPTFSPTETATATALATETHLASATASMTMTATATELPPTMAATQTSTQTEVMKQALYAPSQYSAGDNENGTNVGGLAVLNEQNFRQYLAEGYAQYAADRPGFSHQDYSLAMELARNPVDAASNAALPQGRGPDFWKDGGGLGFDANTVTYFGKDAVVGADPKEFFTPSPDGISRARAVVPMADVEFAILQGIRAAVLARHPNMDPLAAFTTWDVQIQLEFLQAVQANGFVPDKLEKWPGPVASLKDIASFLDNDGRACVAQRPAARDRAHQSPEQFRLVRFTDGLEKQSTMGDETRAHLDARNSAEVLVSFDLAEGDFFKSTRFDVVLHASSPDDIRGRGNEALPDTDSRPVRTEGDRLAPCWLVQPHALTAEASPMPTGVPPTSTERSHAGGGGGGTPGGGNPPGPEATPTPVPVRDATPTPFAGPSPRPTDGIRVTDVPVNTPPPIDTATPGVPPETPNPATPTPAHTDAPTFTPVPPGPSPTPFGASFR